jgi:signal peptidase
MGRARAVAVRAAWLALAAAATAWAFATYGAVYVSGGSMYPTYTQGDLAVLRKGAREVHVGDIVLAAEPGESTGVLHRVVEITLDDRLVLRGDANPIPDLDPVPLADVRGSVAFVVPFGRMFTVMVAIARMVQSHVT